MKKKILSMVFVLSMLCVFVPVTAMAETGIEYGDYLYYQVNSNNTAVTITDCSVFATEIVIPNEIDGVPVTSIGDRAFQHCGSLTSITIPDSVKSIGSYAFWACGSLTSITIPDSVTTIGDHAFYICEGLTDITISDNVTTIGDYAFSECVGLTSVTIPDSVISIGDCAFQYCIKLTSIIIPDNVKSIGEGAFSDCERLRSVTIGRGVTVIGDYAFSDCDALKVVYISDLSAYLNIDFRGDSNPMWYAQELDLNNKRLEGEVIIPEDVLRIPDGAFLGCVGITSVIIPDSVTTIGSYAFKGCSRLTSVVIPKSVTEIKEYAFGDCSNLTTVEYKGSRDKWNEIYIGMSNDYLKNAKIKYTSSVTKTDAGTAYNFDVDAAEKYENSYVYAAVYDESGVLLAVRRVPLEMTGSTTISVNKSANDALAKVFIFAENMQPIITAEEFLLI